MTSWMSKQHGHTTGMAFSPFLIVGKCEIFVWKKNLFFVVNPHWSCVFEELVLLNVDLAALDSQGAWPWHTVDTSGVSLVCRIIGFTKIETWIWQANFGLLHFYMTTRTKVAGLEGSTASGTLQKVAQVSKAWISLCVMRCALACHFSCVFAWASLHASRYTCKCWTFKSIESFLHLMSALYRQLVALVCLHFWYDILHEDWLIAFWLTSSSYTCWRTVTSPVSNSV